MKFVCIFAALFLPVCVLAQAVFVGSGGGFGGGGFSTGQGVATIHGSGQIIGSSLGGLAGVRPVGTGNFGATLRSDGQPFRPRSVTTSYRGHSMAGLSYFTRTVVDNVRHEYFGYEVILEEQQPGTYRATFAQAGVTAMEVATMGAPAKEWSMRPLALPASKIVQDGDVISVELIADAATGEKLMEDIKILPFYQLRPPAAPNSLVGNGLPGQPGARQVATVEGQARDFSAQDAEMRLTVPRLSLNGVEQSTTPSSPTGTLMPRSADLLNRSVAGPLVYFYFPGKGRYILSLAARTELDFQRAGELRGGVAQFTLDGDTFKVECPVEIATGRAPYNLYVLRDSLWEPTAQRQKGQFAIGSVGVEELALFKRK